MTGAWVDPTTARVGLRVGARSARSSAMRHGIFIGRRLINRHTASRPAAVHPPVGVRMAAWCARWSQLARGQMRQLMPMGVSRAPNKPSSSARCSTSPAIWTGWKVRLVWSSASDSKISGLSSSYQRKAPGKSSTWTSHTETAFQSRSRRLIAP